MSIENSSQENYLRYWFSLKRHWLPAAFVFSSTLGLTLIYVLLKTPIYQIQGQIIYEQDKTSSLLGLPGSKESVLNATEADRVLDSELRVIVSQPVLAKTLDVLKRSISKDSLPSLKDFKKHLTVKNAENTNTLQVSYDAENPKLAVLMVNTLMYIYQQNNVQINRAKSIAAKQFITAQLPEVRQHVYRADIALRQFKEHNKIANLEVATKSNAENLARIEGQIDQAQTLLTSQRSDLRNLQQKLGLNAQQALAASNVSQSLAVQTSLADVQGLERKLEEARSQYQENHPIVMDLIAKRSKAKALLNQNVSASVQGTTTSEPSRLQVGATQQELLNSLIKTESSQIGLGNQISTLNQQRSTYLNQAKSLPKLEQRQRELERELAAAETTFQTLLKSLQEVSVSENQTIGNVRIVEPAQVPSEPFSPNKRAAIAAGTLAGLLLAIALVYLLETMDTRVKRVDEAQEIYGFPLIGTIPIFSKKTDNTELSQLPVLREPRSALSESYRTLQANLKFLSSDEPLKVFTITSAIPQEGKSTTCANLVAALNNIGHNVLLVDLDLRRPTQHQIWGLSNELGISNFLAGQVVDIMDVTHIIDKGLHVITSGPIPPNPLGLIDSQRMVNVIQVLSQSYDFVVIDTPPTSIAADAVVVGKITNGAVIVARPNTLEKRSAQVAKDYLNQSGLNVLGLIINGVVLDNEYHYDYCYSNDKYYINEKWDNLELNKKRIEIP
jgi:polysaccharide biosynthesis transport protein